ncbi:MAG: hypothetical protein LGB78_00550, partial [Sulfurovum sp.]|nr:hypothetical protein [Sulfurovum sp.]
PPPPPHTPPHNFISLVSSLIYKMYADLSTRTCEEGTLNFTESQIVQLQHLLLLERTAKGVFTVFPLPPPKLGNPIPKTTIITKTKIPTLRLFTL